jgi:hypothetical protein
MKQKKPADKAGFNFVARCGNRSTSSTQLASLQNSSPLGIS